MTLGCSAAFIIGGGLSCMSGVGTVEFTISGEGSRDPFAKTGRPYEVFIGLLRIGGCKFVKAFVSLIPCKFKRGNYLLSDYSNGLFSYTFPR